jgi:hypothetical protein
MDKLNSLLTKTDVLARSMRISMCRRKRIHPYANNVWSKTTPHKHMFDMFLWPCVIGYTIQLGLKSSLGWFRAGATTHGGCPGKTSGRWTTSTLPRRQHSVGALINIGIPSHRLGNPSIGKCIPILRGTPVYTDALPYIGEPHDMGMHSTPIYGDAIQSTWEPRTWECSSVHCGTAIYIYIYIYIYI